MPVDAVEVQRGHELHRGGTAEGDRRHDRECLRAVRILRLGPLNTLIGTTGTEQSYSGVLRIETICTYSNPPIAGAFEKSNWFVVSVTRSSVNPTIG